MCALAGWSDGCDGQTHPPLGRVLYAAGIDTFSPLFSLFDVEQGRQAGRRWKPELGEDIWDALSDPPQTLTT